MTILWFGESPSSPHPLTEVPVSLFHVLRVEKGHKQPQCWSRGASSRMGRGPEPGWPKLRGACEKNQQIKLKESHWWMLEDNSMVFRSKCVKKGVDQHSV